MPHTGRAHRIAIVPAHAENVLDSTPKRRSEAARSCASTKVRPSSSARCAADPGQSGQLERYDCEYRRKDGQPVRLPRRHRPWRGEDHRPRHQPGLRPLHARPGRSSLSDAPVIRCAGQPLDPFRRRALRRLPAPKPARAQAPGVPHPQARQLAQHGRDRIGVLRGPCSPSYRRQRSTDRGNRRWNSRRNCRPSPDQMDVHPEKARTPQSLSRQRVIISVQSTSRIVRPSRWVSYPFHSENG